MKRVKLQKHKFYVYEHWRPDKDHCFYVGKGYGQRAYNTSHRSNNHYARIAAKLSALGMCIEVRMVQFGLLEEEAFQIEKERIVFWKSCGVKLANYTNGGDGVAGYKRSWAWRLEAGRARRGRKHTEATKLKMSLAQKGKKLSEETKRKISLSHKGKVQVPHTKEHKAKIAAKSRGRKHTAETKAKMSFHARNRSQTHLNRLSAALRGQVIPFEQRLKMSEAARHRPPISEQTRAKLSRASKARKRTPEWLAKLSASVKAVWSRNSGNMGMTGKQHSEETKRKSGAAISAAKAKNKSIVVQ